MIYWAAMVELNMLQVDMFSTAFILHFFTDFLFSEKKVDKKQDYIT